MANSRAGTLLPLSAFRNFRLGQRRWSIASAALGIGTAPAVTGHSAFPRLLRPVTAPLRRLPCKSSGSCGSDGRMGMSSGSLKLDRFPAQSVEIHCPVCDRRGRYAKARLVARASAAGVALLDLLRELSPSCPARARAGTVGTKACGAIFPALSLRWPSPGKGQVIPTRVHP